MNIKDVIENIFTLIKKIVNIKDVIENIFTLIKKNREYQRCNREHFYTNKKKKTEKVWPLIIL